MPRISRRTVLFASVAALLVPAAPAEARTIPAPPPSRFAPTPIPGSTATFTSGRSKGLVATAVGYTAQDATGISLVLQNTGSAEKTVTVAYSDNGRSRFKSHPHTVLVPAGQSRSITVYGHLTHKAGLELTDTSGAKINLPITKSLFGGPRRSAGPTLLSTPPA